MNNNIDPKEAQEATEEQAALNAAEDQANVVGGEPTESAEEGGTEG